MNIKISNHVCNRFIERFNPNLEACTGKNRYEKARTALTIIVDTALYLSDNKDGVLLYSKEYNAKLIVQNKVLKTIWYNKKKNNSSTDFQSVPNKR